MRNAACILLVLTGFAVNGHAQNPVSADLSSRRVTVNEIFHIIINANGSNVKEPDMSGVTGAGVVLGNPSHQSSTSIRTIQGATTVIQSRTWRYPASVSKEGSFTIPRISVTVDGQEYFTQPMTIEVTRTVEMGTRTPDDATELTVDDLAFVRAVTDKTVLYQGQALLLRLRLYVLDQYYVNVESPRALPFPDTEGFYSGAQWQQTSVEQHAGRNYRVTEISQALFPAMPGEATIAAWQWQGAVRWYDARRRQQTSARMFTTNPIPITVLPLPPRPDNFSGAVGKFRMSTHLANDSWVQGTPVRLIVTVSGEGNPNTIGAPTIPEMTWAHISGPEVETRQLENSLEVSKLFSYLITPLEHGEQAIPPVEFTFFAPIFKNYRTERSAEMAVLVQPAGDNDAFIAIGGSAEEQRRKIEIFEGDMLPLITDFQTVTLSSQRRAGRLGFLALASPGITALLLAVAHVLFRQRLRITGDTGYARRYYAKGKFLKSLNETGRRDCTPPHTGSHESGQAVQSSSGLSQVDVLYRSITAFVGDMLNINGAGLTASEVDLLLRDRHVSEELLTVISRILKACERARYAGRDSTPEEIDALRSAAQDAVEQLYDCLWEAYP